MGSPTDLDELMNRFRLASRELFNHFFYLPGRYDDERAWPQFERFCEVEDLLFQKLVAEPAALTLVDYGLRQAHISVESSHGGSITIMLNRKIDSGYWDYPINRISTDARLSFIRYFDWDNLNYHDNRYVRIRVDSCPSNPEISGKHGLIETQYVRFVKVP